MAGFGIGWKMGSLDLAVNRVLVFWYEIGSMVIEGYRWMFESSRSGNRVRCGVYGGILWIGYDGDWGSGS